ncbi:hypothetical protein MMPV_001788 [Pyropia vietnamensis]
MGSPELPECTFDQGFIRQKVFVCRRCTVPDQRAGFCAACKDRCHGDHEEEVFGIYSKRGFRCDCGTGRMKNRCALAGSPAAARERRRLVNTPNAYGHNYSDRYCRCNRTYSPDYGDMLQCAVCEDWWHELCMTFPARRNDGRSGSGGGGSVADGGQSGRGGGSARRGASVPVVVRRGELGRLPKGNFEFSCHECTARLPFLADYYRIRGQVLPHTVVGEDLDTAHQKLVGGGCSRPAPSSVSSMLIQCGVDFLWASGWRYDLCDCSDGGGGGGGGAGGSDGDGARPTPTDAARAVADIVWRGDLSAPRSDDEDVALFEAILTDADTGAGPIDTDELARVYGQVKRKSLALLRRR